MSSNSCLYELRSGPAYVTYNGPAKHTVYPGECIQTSAVFDDWDNDITDQTNLQVNVLSGTIRAISYNEPDWSVYIWISQYPIL